MVPRRGNGVLETITIVNREDEKKDRPPRMAWIPPRLVTYGGLTAPILMAVDTASPTFDGKFGMSGMALKT